VDDLLKKLGLPVTKFGGTRSKQKGGSQTRSKSKSRSQQIKELQPSTDSFDVEHPFYGRVLVFTKTKNKKHSWQRVKDVGGEPGDKVKTNTNFLVYGEMKNKTDKMRAAERLRDAGQDIRIITEEEFLHMLGD